MHTLFLSAGETLDDLQPHELRHNLVKDLHVFGSYVTGHLPWEHPHVIDTTHDDRAEEGVFLGNDLINSNFSMYSFRANKIMMLSDPKYWDHILPFMQGMLPMWSLSRDSVCRLGLKECRRSGAGSPRFSKNYINQS